MPSFLPPEAARFELRDGSPVVTLAVDAAVERTAGCHVIFGTGPTAPTTFAHRLD